MMASDFPLVVLRIPFLSIDHAEEGSLQFGQAQSNQGSWCSQFHKIVIACCLVCVCCVCCVYVWVCVSVSVSVSVSVCVVCGVCVSCSGVLPLEPLANLSRHAAVCYRLSLVST
jgi:hypothetical protein